MFDTTILKEIASALDHAARVAKAKADQYAAHGEHDDAGKQLARENRTRAWGAELRRATRALESARYTPKKVAGDAADTPGFQMFWAAYPKKAGRGDAKRAWEAMQCEGVLDQILASIGTLRKSFDWLKEGGQYIPHPATWLRREGWNDELFTPEQIAPEDPRKEKAEADPPKWKEFLAAKNLKATPYKFAPPHWKKEFTKQEAEDGF